MNRQELAEHSRLLSLWAKGKATRKQMLRFMELDGYVQHKFECAKNVPSMDGGLSHFDDGQPCTCGLDAARKGRE